MKLIPDITAKTMIKTSAVTVIALTLSLAPVHAAAQAGGLPDGVQAEDAAGHTVSFDTDGHTINASVRWRNVCL